MQVSRCLPRCEDEDDGHIVAKHFLVQPNLLVGRSIQASNQAQDARPLFENVVKIAQNQLSDLVDVASHQRAVRALPP